MGINPGSPALGAPLGHQGRPPTPIFISENGSLYCFPYVWKALLKQPGKLWTEKWRFWWPPWLSRVLNRALPVSSSAPEPCQLLRSASRAHRADATGKNAGPGWSSSLSETSLGPHSMSLTPRKPRLELRRLGGGHGGDVCGVLDSDFKPGCNTGDVGALVPG